MSRLHRSGGDTGAEVVDEPQEPRCGSAIPSTQPTMTIVSDDSEDGWGGHLGDWVVSGQWSVACAKRNINWLELQAVWLTIKHFMQQWAGAAVDVLQTTLLQFRTSTRKGERRPISSAAC